MLLHWFFDLCVHLRDEGLLPFSMIRSVVPFVERLWNENVVVGDWRCMTDVPGFGLRSRCRFQP